MSEENTNLPLQQTCLYDRHVALGAKMSPFAGFMMPIQYDGITQEHLAVREKVGMFDVSHMGEIFVEGPFRRGPRGRSLCQLYLYQRHPRLPARQGPLRHDVL